MTSGYYNGTLEYLKDFFYLVKKREVFELGLLNMIKNMGSFVK